MILTATAPQVRAQRADGCDRCGVDNLGRPLRDADVAVTTAAGVVLLCRTHHVAHAAALSESGLDVSTLPG